ncbi:hypothetical protein BV22DRAFT_929630 [Leucogyrophana mollusca]|uniref:Uncharacterized protein n=1 Tax=Leucogyrophana mollusca TaxID=85980 RepID=A0ACB8AZ97_9AGAM|nr:hypothetical protein BV22DRAFT_929630 [Leucogyrophana mollusca]
MAARAHSAATARGASAATTRGVSTTAARSVGTTTARGVSTTTVRGSTLGTRGLGICKQEVRRVQSKPATHNGAGAQGNEDDALVLVFSSVGRGILGSIYDFWFWGLISPIFFLTLCPHGFIAPCPTRLLPSAAGRTHHRHPQTPPRHHRLIRPSPERLSDLPRLPSSFLYPPQHPRTPVSLPPRRPGPKGRPWRCVPLRRDGEVACRYAYLCDWRGTTDVSDERWGRGRRMSAHLQTTLFGDGLQ